LSSFSKIARPVLVNWSPKPERASATAPARGLDATPLRETGAGRAPSVLRSGKRGIGNHPYLSNREAPDDRMVPAALTSPARFVAFAPFLRAAASASMPKAD
jgi:hypothetical protein